MTAVLALCASVAFVYWLVSLIVIRRSARSVPTLRAGVDLPEPREGWPSVCIVIPAHNEQAVIGALARSLAGQVYPNLSVVFALDRCTDDTRAVLETEIGDDPRFEIVEIDVCPDDWAGKTHAAHTGVELSQAAHGADLLLFADADTEFDPACVRAAVALLLQRDVDLLSLLSTLSSDRWWERIVQPVAAFELLRHFPIQSVNRPGAKRAFANGQFLLFRRSAYDRIGGHESVRNDLLEDLAFARRLRRTQSQGEAKGIALLIADGLLRCRMYAAWPEFTRGWRRIFIEAAGRRPDRLHRWAAQLMLMSLAAPIALLLSAIAGIVSVTGRDGAIAGWAAIGVAAAGAFVWLGAIATIHRLQHAPIWTALLHPFGAWLVRRIVQSAARDLESGPGIEWAGRTYALAARPPRT